jgi:hypothetical protein
MRAPWILSALGALLAVVAGCGGSGQVSDAGVEACPLPSCCAFDQSYAFVLPDGKVGGFYPRDTVTIVRIPPGSDVGMNCSVQLPDCGGTAIDTSDLLTDIADPAVQQALTAVPGPVFGDRSATGAPTFSFAIGITGGGFSILVGFECASATATCDPTPPGVSRLMTDVETAVTTALADPSCAGI